MRSHRTCFGAVVGVLLLCASLAHAQDPADLPQVLRDWTAWVRKDHDYVACPMLVHQPAEEEDSYVCAWPGELAIDARERGARFSQHWTVYARSAVPLPGDTEHWPQAVTANGQAAAVVADEDGAPITWLEPGSYAIEGAFNWVHRPESLPVPADTALLRLTLDGAPIFPLQREDDALWFGRAEAATKEADSLDVQVFRKLSDGVPAMLSTQIMLDVSGEGREEKLGVALPAGWQATQLDGELPARLDSDGTLVVQLRPGSYTLTLQARALAPLSTAQRATAEEPWPEQEIWSFESDSRLRVVVPEAANTIDPSQAGVPGEWTSLPAFLLQGDEKLAVQEQSRGLSAQDQNRLNLSREMWLDFDGGAYTTKDMLIGQMVRDWRLDVAAPYALTRASAGNDGLLVTRGAKPGFTGVEVRERNVSVSAATRLQGKDSVLPIAGWQQSFDSVSTTLHLPPGYRLYAALGADQAPQAWISRWNLLDVFLVAVTSLLAAWLAGIPFALVVLAYLVLGFQEMDLPLFSLLAVLAIGLLVKLLPNGKLSAALRWIRNAALVVLVLLSLPFVAAQVRLALYPQLEQWSADHGYAQSMTDYETAAPVMQVESNAQGGVMADAAPPASAPVPLYDRSADKLQSMQVTGSRLRNQDKMQRYANNTVLQAGYGEPDWSWSSYGMSWSGPVLPDQTVRLLISPPWLTRLLRLVLVALLGVLIARLAREAWAIRKQLRGTAVALVLGALCLPGLALAQATPGAEVLEELQQRVLAAPDCAPNCGYIASAHVSAEGDSVRIAIEVHAAARVAIPVPASDELLAVESLRVDGVADSGVLRKEDGANWIVVSRGVHRIDIVARAAAAEKIGLTFPLKPAWVVFDGKDWEASGLREERLLTDTLELVRVRRSDNAAVSAGVAQQFPPFVRLTRYIYLDLDWRVDTRVDRVAPQQAGFSVAVPLLPGEHVTSSEFKVADGRATVPIQAGEQSSLLRSQLDRSDTLKLTAPDLSAYSETWIVVANPMWSMSYSGVPAVYPVDPNDWAHEFHPLPGESLTLTVTRPEAVSGPFLAIDSATLTSAIGKRAAEHTLELSLRSTQGGQHAIELPKDAEVLSILVDGATLNVRPEAGKLNLPVTPGKHAITVRWRETGELGVVSRTPAVKLNAQVSNLRLNLNLPADRWVLRTSGPRVGPAVLYWGELVVMALLAFGLSRLRRTPLKPYEWLLLGLGFSTFSWPALVVVVAWLLALDARARAAAGASNLVFNLRQVGLVALTALALFALFVAIPYGLLGEPDMHLTGNGSTPQNLRWFHDQSAGNMPQALAFSLPMWAYKTAMLLWALWLANALIGWLRWAWSSYCANGYWRTAPKREVVVQPTAAATTPPAAPDGGATPSA